MVALIVLVYLLLLTVIAPPSIGSGSGWDSDTSRALGDEFGYGNETITFDNTSDMELYGSAIVDNGRITLSNILHHADFDDGLLHGWVASIYQHEMVDNMVKLWQGGNMEMRFEIWDFTFSVDFMFPEISNATSEGVIFIVGSGEDTNFGVQYSTQDESFKFWVYKDMIHTDLGTQRYVLNASEWYHFTIDHRGDNFKVHINDDLLINHTLLNTGLVWGIRFGTRDVSTMFVDNTSILTGDSIGRVVIPTVQRPFNRWWDKVEVRYSAPGDSNVSYSVFDSYNNRSWWSSLRNVTSPVTNISVIFPYETDRLYLEIELEASNWEFPVVEWVRFYWKPDPPTWSDTTPRRLETLEDEPLEKVWDLSKYTGDWFVAGYELQHFVVGSSDPTHVLPVIEGRNLSIELPTPDWFGEETFELSVSDGEFTTLSPVITVVVHPVNDAPAIEDPGTIDVIEGQETRFDLEPYMTDVDNSTEDLTIAVDSPNCTLEGHVLVLYYDMGNIEDDVVVRISDGLLEGNRTLRVAVENVNDPPVLGDVPLQQPTEEVPLEVDLAPYLSDEDHPVAGLQLSSDDPHVVSVEGTVVTLLYDEWVEPYRLVLTVSDGVAETVGGFDVEVTPVNDPPRIVSVGGKTTGSPISFDVPEGTTVWLEVVVDDPDNDVFGYYVTTDLSDVTAHPNGTLEVSPGKGDLGDFTVTLVVDDRVDGTDEVSVTVTVLDVNDPVSRVLLTSPPMGKVVREGDNVTFDATFDDPDLAHGQVLDVVWSSNISGVFAIFTSEDFEAFTVNDLPVGVHLITVTVSDREFERSASGELTVEAVDGDSPGPDGNGGDGDGGMPVLWISVVVILIVVLLLGYVAITMKKGRDGN